jgi:hypothetical protein
VTDPFVVPDPLPTVIAQLAAYNARDIQGFAATFSDDIVVMDLETNTERLRGKAALIERYSSQFRTYPKQFSNVVNRTVCGQYVIDLEHITGMPRVPEPTAANPDLSGGYLLLAIYRVQHGVITHCWFSPRTITPMPPA